MIVLQLKNYGSENRPLTLLGLILSPFVEFSTDLLVSLPKLRIFACERKNQRWKDMELMSIRKSGSENRPLTPLMEMPCLRVK